MAFPSSFKWVLGLVCCLVVASGLAAQGVPPAPPIDYIPQPGPPYKEMRQREEELRKTNESIVGLVRFRYFIYGIIMLVLTGAGGGGAAAAWARKKRQRDVLVLSPETRFAQGKRSMTMRATIITADPADHLAGTTHDGRPVRFSEASWRWYYTDRPAAEPAEYVAGHVVVRRP